MVVSYPKPTSNSVAVAAVCMEGAISKKWTRGENAQATEFGHEFSLELVERFENVSGPLCGMITAQFGIFKLDAI